MRNSMERSKLALGCCYYPEHWDRTLWRDDLKRMKEHGLEIIRVGEFAWSLMEREEGVFDFSFWDGFLRLAEEEGMQVIFCTPTATPPAWLTEKYPETLNADGDGHLLRHGMRRHHNLTSPKYLELCGRLTERMAEHFNRYSCIIGWQLDNEVNCEIDEYYSESDHKAFRAYLREKFGSLEALNDKLGTVFWNQTYTDWNQIYLPRRTPQGLNGGNPHLKLEQKRFISHAAVGYLGMQASILRRTAGSRFITTNGIFNNLDYQKLLASGVDFICYDSYPDFAYELGRKPEDGLKDRNTSFNLARVRAISPVFGIMEQQSGPGGWNTRMMQPAPKPGQMRLWTWQSIAHGADMVSYFRWRTCGVGTEIYWHGLNDYSNLPNRRLAELKRIHTELLKADGIAGHPYEAGVAVLTDYDNNWDGDTDQWHGPLRRFSMDGWFRAMQKKHIPFDFVDFRDETQASELMKYELVVYPHATLLTDERSAVLRAYVEQGGKLVMGSRTGYKDLYGRCPMRPMPGPAGELCGVRVTDYTFLGPYDEEEYFVWDGEEAPAPVFNDILEAENTGRTEGVFKNNYYDGKPALVSRELGKGCAWYFGAGFAEETAALFLKKLGIHSPAERLGKLPEQVELAIRGDRAILLNYGEQPCNVTLAGRFGELLGGRTLEGECELEGYGVWVLALI